MKNITYLLFLLTITQYSPAALSSDWSWHGFVAQGVIQVNDSNFVEADEDLSFKLTEVGINTAYQINPNFRIAAQASYLNSGNRYEEGVRLDYLFLDWTAYTTLDWQVNVYLGRFKNQHWLYSATRDVPFTRPSIVLPQSVYFDGFRDIAVGSDGLAIGVSNSNQFGELEFNWSYGSSPVSKKQSQLLLSKQAAGDVEQEYVHQASAFWQPALSQWRLGLSFVDSEFSYDSIAGDYFAESDFKLQRSILIANYSGEFIEFATEVFQERFVVDGFYQPQFHNDQLGQGAFFQFQYKYSPDIKLTARYDYFDLNKDDRDGNILHALSGGTVPKYFAYHRDFLIGASYDVAPNIRIQAEYHAVQGSARLTPVVLPDVAANNKKNWDFWAVQVMYWF